MQLGRNNTVANGTVQGERGPRSGLGVKKRGDIQKMAGEKKTWVGKKKKNGQLPSEPNGKRKFTDWGGRTD